ncbi:Ig-like domain-containing protein [Mesonia sp. K7]|uniref:Ig-like domain-containing protein n=1 Tax=Mesonia sp. K7 TaxID=2218606 RepID=UPI000DAA4C35|nr:Ig-like domain-containing protein [Mesonia sp. K7]PZD78084.1 hypothetical protein DNG35_06855 [Mesonia sp. K7]
MRQSYNNYISYFTTIGFEKFIKFFGTLMDYAGIQKHYLVTVFIFFVFSLGVFGQTDLVRWNNHTSAPTPLVGNMTANQMVLGGGVTISDAAWSGFRVNNLHNGSSNTINYSKYIEFRVTPSAGYKIALSQFKLNYNSPNNDNGPTTLQVRYSTNSTFPSNGTLLGSPVTLTRGSNQYLTLNFPSGYEVNQTLYIRIYLYGQPSVYYTDFYIRNTTYNASTQGPTLTGTVSAALPIVQNDNAVTAENTAVNIDILDNDTYGTLSAINITQQPTNGQNITVNGLSDVTYTPNTSYIGTDSFKYTITDEKGTSSEATVNINVSAPTAPTAVADVVSVPTDLTTNINVLSNDSSGSGAYDDVIIVSNPTNGAVTVNTNNTVAYTPNSGYTGTDSFQYKVTNIHGLTSNTVTVDVNVTCNCTNNIVSGSGGAIIINSGQTYCLTSGSWSGGLTMNGGTLCVSAGATFTASYTTGAFSGNVINNGTITAFPLSTGSTHTVDILNKGSLTSAYLQNFAGGIENYGTLTVNGGLETLNGAEINNYGNLTSNSISFYDTTVNNYSNANFTVNSSVNVYSGSWDNRLDGEVYLNGSNVNFTGALDNSGYWEFERLSGLSATLNNYGHMQVHNQASNISSTTYLTNDDLLEFIDVPEIQYNGPMLTNNGTLTVTHSTSGNFKMNQSINQVFNNGKIEVSGQFEQNASGSKLVNNCHIVCKTYFLGNGDTTNNGLIHAIGTGTTSGRPDGINIEGTTSDFYNSETGFVRGVNFRNSGDIKGYGSFYFTGTTNNNSAGTFIGDSASQQILFYDTTQTGSNIFDAPGGTVTNVLRPSSMTPLDELSYNCTAPPSSAGSPPDTEEVEFLYCDPQTVNFDLDDYATPAPAVGGDPFVLLYSSIKLFEFNNSSNPTNNSTNLVISGKGTFTANTSNGEIQFIPNAGFTSGVVEAEYRISNKRSGDPITYPSPKTKITITFISIDPPAITIESGTNPVCIDDTVTLSNEIEGGVWESSNNAIATVDASGVVTGISVGTATISYTVTEETCEETVEQEINVEACASGFMITNPMTRQRIKSN